jgi:hypothetical protein
LRSAATAGAALQRASRVFPAAKPASLLWNGVLQASRGAMVSAEAMLRAALAGAEQLTLAFERQRASEEISRLSGMPGRR